MNKISPHDKLNGLKELQVYYRALKICKWYNYYKKKNLKRHINLIKYIYEI